jgi:sec-independent protein translocase protein TatC
VARRLGSRFRRVAPDDHLSAVEHLTELRDRLALCAAAIVVAFIAMYATRDRLVSLLTAPLPATQRQLATFSPTEPFMTTVTVVFWASIVISLPVVIYQAYAFAAPAVAAPSRRRMLATAGALSGLFVAGIVFTYTLVLPTALRFLLGFGGSAFDVQLRANEYLSFATTLLVAGGVVFEVPVVMVCLARLGVANARLFASNRRLAVIIITIVSAVLPGGDAISMLMLLAVQVALYEAGILACRLVGERHPGLAAHEAW